MDARTHRCPSSDAHSATRSLWFKLRSPFNEDEPVRYRSRVAGGSTAFCPRTPFWHHPKLDRVGACTGGPPKPRAALPTRARWCWWAAFSSAAQWWTGPPRRWVGSPPAEGRLCLRECRLSSGGGPALLRGGPALLRRRRGSASRSACWRPLWAASPPAEDRLCVAEWPLFSAERRLPSGGGQAPLPGEPACCLRRAHCSPRRPRCPFGEVRLSAPLV
jgi:hypothetical protein